MKGAAAAHTMPTGDSRQSEGLVDAIRKASKAPAQRKTSYAVPCSTEFRDAVTLLAERRKVNVGDIARSVILTMPPVVIENMPDPGEPNGEDRETVILKSGPSAGKPWRRKPRLQVRMPAGFEVVTIRKALALALELDRGKLSITLEDANQPSARERLQARDEQVSRLRSMVGALSFDVLPHGIRSREDALFVLGFAPSQRPEMSAIRARFRMLATIHHPDSEVGDHERMSQLNDAMAYLRRYG